MSDCLEVLFVSDKNGKIQTASCYDPHVGTTLMSYRNGGGSATNTLSIVGNDYLISADECKPLLHVWPLNSQEPSSDLRTVAPGKPSALSVSPDGYYCVAGIETKIYIWEISSGCLLNVISRHYRTVNKVLFLDDSSHFITCGEDGLILVWKLADVFPKRFGDVFNISTGQIAPVFKFTSHSLPVTDIFVGCGNLNARLFSVSADQTCKIFSLNDGSLLLSIVFNYVLTSVTVNELETELFVGTSSGKIQMYNLEPFPRTLEYHVPENLQNDFIGHTKSVNFLAVSFDGTILASGSDDEKVFLWNIPGKQLIRSFEMKGPVSGMFFSLVSKNIFSNKFNPALIISKFQKISNLEEKNLVLNVWVHDNLSPISFERDFVQEKISDKNQEGDGDVEALKQEILKLKSVNKQLYQFAMNKILKNPLSVGIKNSDTPLENSVDLNGSTFNG